MIAFKQPPTVLQPKRKNSFTFYENNELEKVSQGIIYQVQELLSVPEAEAIEVCLSSKWDIEQISLAFLANPNFYKVKVEKVAASKNCLCCFSPCPKAEIVALPCNHVFCSECFAFYL